MNHAHEYVVQKRSPRRLSGDCSECGGDPRDGLFDGKVMPGTNEAERVGTLTGTKLLKARRRGKQLWLEFCRCPALLIHLGMTGSIAVENVERFVYTDFKVDDKWPPPDLSARSRSHGGAPVSGAFGGCLRGSRCPVKALLLNQNGVVCGV